MPTKVATSRKTKAAIAVLLILSSCFALAWGLALARAAHGTILDFKIVYYGANCLVRNHDPYNPSQLLQLYFAEGGEPVPQAAQGYRTQMIVASQMYLPTAALLFAPLGLLEWPIAYSLWVGLTVCGITAAAALMWIAASRYAASPPLYLILFLLLNSGILFSGGNPAGVAVGLCVIAAWCFLEDRLINLGLLCMAVSLALKPHDAGLVWLYFLMASAAMRKRALKSLAVTALIAVVALGWMRQVSPHWFAELLQNVQEYSLRGSYNDPGPSAIKFAGTGMIIDLQTVTSVIRDDPAFYKLSSYMLCAPLLAYWGLLTLRSRVSATRGWLGLAVIAPLTMLPVYHRPYDAKLLLLTIPACAMLWSRGRTTAGLSVILTGTAIFFTSDFPLALLSILSKGMHVPAGPWGSVATILLMRPAPLALLALGGFNLFHYAKACHTEDSEDGERKMDSLLPWLRMGSNDAR